MQPFSRNTYCAYGSSAIAALLLVWLVAACNFQKKEALYCIPNTAKTVVKIDFASATQKAINIHNLFDIDFFKELYALGELPNRKKIQESGLDLMKPIYLFTDSLTTSQEGVPTYTLTLVANVISENLFRKFVADFEFPITHQPNEKCYSVTFPRGYLAWNQELAILSYWIEGDSLAQLSRQVHHLLQLPETQQLIASQAEARQILQENNDIAIWSVLSPLRAHVPIRLPKSLPVSDILATTQATFALRFEQGEVVVDGTLFLGDKRLQKIIEAFQDSTSLDLIESIPAEKPLTVFALKLNLRILYRLLAEYELATFLDPYLFFVGTSLQEILETFDGNIVVALVDATQPNQASKNKSTALATLSETYIGLGIADEKKYQKLIQNFELQGIISRQADYYYSSYLNVSILSKENYVAIVTSPFLREAILKNQTFSDSSSDLPFDKTTAQFFARTQGLAHNVIPDYADYASELENIYCKFYVQDQQFKMNARLKMREQQQNSLITLLQLFFNKNKAKNFQKPNASPAS